MQKDAFELEAEVQFQQRLAEEIKAALNQDKSVTDHRKYIEEQLLTLRCPVGACAQAFSPDLFDFEHDCLVLICSRDQNHHFCGWCLTDCGTWEAGHRHVANCVYNENQDKNVFSTRALFDRCHQQRWRRLVQNYLDTLPIDTKNDVLEECRNVLLDHGINLQ